MTGPSEEMVACPLCGSDRYRELLVVEHRRIVRCLECGVVFRNPRPTAAAYDEEFRSGRAEVADEARLGARRGAMFKSFLDAWPERPGRVLDVGCGGGWFLRAAVDRGWSGVGVDPSPAAVRHAKEVLRVDALPGKVEAQRFAPGSFDLVTLWNVLDVVPDPLGLLRAVRPLLRAGGVLYLRTPNDPFQRAAFRATRAARALGVHGVFDRRPDFAFVFNVTAFSGRTVRLLLGRAGFTEVRVTPSPPAPGDPYRALGLPEWPLSAVKTVATGVARAAWVLSGRRWIAGASLEASARRR